MTLGKLLNISEPQSLHLQNGDDIYVAGLLEEQIGYQVEYLDNAWHLEDTQYTLFPPISTLYRSPPIIHSESTVWDYGMKYEVWGSY